MDDYPEKKPPEVEVNPERVDQLAKTLRQFSPEARAWLKDVLDDVQVEGLMEEAEEILSEGE